MRSMLSEQESSIEKIVVQDIYDAEHSSDKYIILKDYIENLEHCTEDRRSHLLNHLETHKDDCLRLDKMATNIFLVGQGCKTIKTELKFNNIKTDNEEEEDDEELEEISNHSRISIDNYINKIQYQKTNKEDEVALTNEDLVARNLKFVIQCAHKYKHIMPFEDLIQEGNLGLVQAAERFDRSKNIKFISYAVHWILLRMREAIKHNHLIRNGIKKGYKFTYIDSMTNEDSKNTLEEILNVQTSYDTPVDNIIERETFNNLYSSLKLLSDTERDIVIRRFGINGSTPITLRELAAKHNYTIPNIALIEKKALAKLHKYMEEKKYA